ncbi:KpsF/GutQ family sugar-phosphate isomerase [Heyndrickxia acidiproducens]|uniref:KpsF/GutQ family sugar-phosphate isomerase n=1 Tax=Heyndrickxia acidiproducens TaxID=1121084 RepID=UPI00037A99A6|nr:SIS domain-containing protein [Heyndrickxia acidiproducens]
MSKKLIESVFNTWKIEAESLLSLKDCINQDALKEVIQAIKNCKGNIIITGCGTSGAAAKKIVHTLSVINISSFYLNPSDAVHGSLGNVKKEDIVILISKGGNTSEIVTLIPNLKEKGAKIIGVTENKGSIIGQRADILLKIIVDREPDQFNMLATASTLAVIATFDAIAITLIEELSFDKEKFLENHPAGAVGARLKKDSE